MRDCPSPVPHSFDGEKPIKEVFKEIKEKL